MRNSWALLTPKVFPTANLPRLGSPILRGWDSRSFKSIGVLLGRGLRIFAPWSRLDSNQNNGLHLFKTPRCVQCNGPSILKFLPSAFHEVSLSSVDNILLVSEVTALLSDLGLSHTIFTGNATTQHRPLNSSMIYPVNSSMANLFGYAKSQDKPWRRPTDTSHTHPTDPHLEKLVRRHDWSFRRKWRKHVQWVILQERSPSTN